MPRERCKYSGMVIKGGKNDRQGQVGGGGSRKTVCVSGNILSLSDTRNLY